MPSDRRLSAIGWNTLGVDGEHGDTAVHQRLDDWSMQRLDRDGDLIRLRRLGAQPIDHGTDPGSVVRKRSLDRVSFTG
ncbi:MAG: hypothetical protein ACRYG8_37740 [Janthinobacterium lividum]